MSGIVRHESLLADNIILFPGSTSPNDTGSGFECAESNLHGRSFLDVSFSPAFAKNVELLVSGEDSSSAVAEHISSFISSFIDEGSRAVVQLANWSAPLGSAAQFLVGRKARQENDESTARELNASGMRQALPEGLSLRWLGTAGFELAYENFHLVIDPHLSRYSLRSVLSNHVLKPQSGLLDRHVPEADAILVGHTHFDHALDVPELARRRGCKVYGSGSLRALMGLADQEDHAVAVEPGRVYSLGPFDVTFVRSLHSKLLLGLKVNGEGEITCDHLDHMNQGEYRCGQVFGIHIAVAGRTFYHQGSANLIESELLHRDVDYLLCGIAGRGFTPNFTERILTSLRPQTIIAHHHDNFFLPIDEPMGFSFNVNFGGFVEDVRQVSADFEVRVFEPLQSL